MVRSRSETNLNRIFVDLCTSPDLRSKVPHQRQYHPPLPTLKSIKSNSCSNIDELLQSTVESPPVDVERNDLLAPKKSHQSTSIPLVPMASTGFVLQPTSPSSQTSLSLFETLTINHTRKTSSLPVASPVHQQPEATLPSLSSTSSNSSQDWKQQDFTSRLRNRLSSRGHLRKFFLS